MFPYVFVSDRKCSRVVAFVRVSSSESVFACVPRCLVVSEDVRGCSRVTACVSMYSRVFVCARMCSHVSVCVRECSPVFIGVCVC